MTEPSESEMEEFWLRLSLVGSALFYVHSVFPHMVTVRCRWRDDLACMQLGKTL